MVTKCPDPGVTLISAAKIYDIFQTSKSFRRYFIRGHTGVRTLCAIGF